MIYTVTLNPSLDYVARVSELKPGNLHRMEAEELYVGGKGINVTTVLRQLDTDSLILGFIAGFTGREIENRLHQRGIPTAFITASEGLSRINIKLKSEQAVETEINGQGPVITMKELEILYQSLGRLQDGDILVLSGSVPTSIKNRDHTYADICDHLKNRRLKLIVDAEGQLLRNTLSYRPFLIKPNRQELEGLFQRSLPTEESILYCAKQLQAEGAQNVLVSLAGEGALLLNSHGGVIRQRAPQGKVFHSVGAGDALVAGFLFGLLKSGKDSLSEDYHEEDYERALKYGVAAGSAAAFTEGLPRRDKIQELFLSL